MQPKLNKIGEIAKVNEIDIWYETFGDKKNKPLFLIMGGCCQGILWHAAFCERLASEGFYVIRYDHRDSGLSTCFDFKKQSYGLMEMAKDAVALLDYLEIEKAQLFGVSMGAFIAEIIAGYFSHIVSSILLLGSTCEIRPMNLAYAGKPAEEDAELSPPKKMYLSWMKEFVKLSPQTFEERVAQRMEGWNRLNGTEFPLDNNLNRELQAQFLSRLQYPQGILNHIAMLNTLQSEKLVRLVPSKIQIPVVILQGSEDPIFPPDHGQALRKQIKHSEYLAVRGMGHVPNDHFYSLYIDILKKQTIMQK